MSIFSFLFGGDDNETAFNATDSGGHIEEAPSVIHCDCGRDGFLQPNGNVIHTGTQGQFTDACNSVGSDIHIIGTDDEGNPIAEVDPKDF